MKKTKILIISFSIALVVLLITNYFIVSFNNSKYIEIFVFKEDMLKGSKVESNNLLKMQVQKTEEELQALNFTKFKDNLGKVLLQDVSKGEILTEDKLCQVEEQLTTDGQYSYISIPIDPLTYPTCKKLKRGDKVIIYYTAKQKEVNNAIKDKQRIYANTERDGMVTCLLFEAAEVISLHDSTGKQNQDSVITDIIIRVSKEEAMLVANLKVHGTFDIVLN